MCNLSQGIVEKGRAEGMAKGRAEGMAKGRAEGMAKGRAEGMAKGRAEGMAKGRAEGMAKGRAEGMAKGIFDANIGSIRAMVSELHLTVEQAMNVLKIPPSERDRYRAALDV